MKNNERYILIYTYIHTLIYRDLHLHSHDHCWSGEWYSITLTILLDRVPKVIYLITLSDDKTQATAGIFGISGIGKTRF